KSRMDEELVVALQRFLQGDSRYFAPRLPTGEQWRCIADFKDSALFLDIETTGISIRSPITVVGVFDGSSQHALVRGQNLTREALEGLLSSASMLVTYNGSVFDLPALQTQFPGVVPAVPHVDLRHPLRKLGLVGGLKSIERELGIERSERVEYMTGQDAAHLWRLWERRGNRNALSLLLEYNEADCRGLKPLMLYAYVRLKRRIFDAVIGPGKIDYAPL
ncbi:MAG: ribonuclease H-like domain-containing protein, partial [Thermoplasmata archaeon]